MIGEKEKKSNERNKTEVRKRGREGGRRYRRIERWTDRQMDRQGIGYLMQSLWNRL